MVKQLKVHAFDTGADVFEYILPPQAKQAKHVTHIFIIFGETSLTWRLELWFFVISNPTSISHRSPSETLKVDFCDQVMLEWYTHLRFQSSFFILDLLDIHQIADFMAMSMLNSFKTLPEPQTQVIDWFFFFAGSNLKKKSWHVVHEILIGL